MVTPFSTAADMAAVNQGSSNSKPMWCYRNAVRVPKLCVPIGLLDNLITMSVILTLMRIARTLSLKYPANE